MIASHRPRIVYVTRDIERALGIAPHAKYRIVTNYSAYAEDLQRQYPEYVTLIRGTDTSGASCILDTADLLEHPDAKQVISESDGLVVFKTNARVETIASEHGWNLLNPKAAIAEQVENKVTQVEWLASFATKFLPTHRIALGKDVTWHDFPFVVQWAHGHTGDGTILISSEKDAAAVRSKFPERPVRISAYVRGPSFTVNAVATPGRTLMGNVNYQITGMAPFTDNQFATVGNDWSLPYTILTEDEFSEIEHMVGEIGGKLETAGWRGLFGIDFIRDEEHNKIYLIEINARQPAGSVYESRLQETNRKAGVHGVTLFEAHLSALMKEIPEQSLIPINDGAQIIQRVTKDIKEIPNGKITSLKEKGYTVVSYSNSDVGTDLLRIQSSKGIMENHAKFNVRGKEITEILNDKS